jgi:hypothetical protein
LICLGKWWVIERTHVGMLVGAALVLLLRDFLSSWTDAWGVVTPGDLCRR